MQFTATIAPDGNQRYVANLPEAVIDPQALQQLVDKLGACFDELLGGNACVKRATEPALEDIHMCFDIGTLQLMRRPDARVVGLVGKGGKGCVSILFG